VFDMKINKKYFWKTNI